VDSGARQLHIPVQVMGIEGSHIAQAMLDTTAASLLARISVTRPGSTVTRSTVRRHCALL